MPRSLRTLWLSCTVVALAACNAPPPAGGDSPLPADLAGVDSAAADATVDSRPPPRLVLQLDPTLPAWLGARLHQLLAAPAGSLALQDADADDPLDGLGAGSLVLAVGDTAAARRLIPADDPALDALAPDGFVLRSDSADGVLTVATRGKGNAEHFGIAVNRGALYGAYAALERLGFAFLHPLDPLIPAALSPPDQPLQVASSPHWPVRGWHVHTMHPTELTEMLNGWGKLGIDDPIGFEQLLDEWRLFCEWLLANRQNQVQWVLLWAESWQDYADSPLRQQRLRRLTEIAHQHGLAVGVDVGIALQQQHTFRLVREQGDLADETQQIHQRADYLMGAGFDYISTEIGTSEFTSPDDTRMLAWIDELGSYLASQYQSKIDIKIHCSTGQTAPSFEDPKTHDPLNYNFLPHYAISAVGVLPHTVQFYGLDDPAPTYGNTDFDYMRRFLRQEAGLREVLWHPETAYWVSFDVDVPLFLPIYAQRRLHDLRLIASDELDGLVGEGPHAGSRIQGQMVFSSGWEWGYWLNDVIAARGAWDPQLAAPTANEAFKAALAPVLRAFGDAAPALATALASIAEDQHRLLILGEVDGVVPDEIERRNGQAYMQGWDSFDDVGSLIAGVPGVPHIQTQPDKLGLVSMRNPLHGPPDYDALRPLLAKMATTFAGHQQVLADLRPQVPQSARPLLDELADSARITALRARQLLGLYDYVDGLDLLGNPSAAALLRLADARAALDEAQQLVTQREQRYRVPADRIAGWRDNPTAYPFTYLWTVRSLHYWWRDEAKAVKAPISPCYLNIMNPADVAFGEGFAADAAGVIGDVLSFLGLGSFIGDCLAPPGAEPSYPPDGVR